MLIYGSRLPKWAQNRSRIGLKSDHGTKTRILDFTHKQMVLVKLCGSGGSKIDQNRIIHEASKTTPKNVTKGAQLDPKNGPGWGHVELQNRLGRGEERR